MMQGGGIKTGSSFPPVISGNGIVSSNRAIKTKDPALLRAERFSFDRQQRQEQQEQQKLYQNHQSQQSQKIFPLLSKTATLEPRNRIKKAVVAPPPKVVYKYKHVPGNNGRVILYNFRKRPWWHSGNEKKGSKAVATEGVETSKAGAKEGKKKDEESPKPIREAINFDMVWEMSRNPKRYKYSDYTQVVLNHLENNSHLVSKKCLYFSIRDYYAKSGKDVLEMIPRTFYLAPNETDSRGELKQFIDFNAKYKSPGENLRTESPVKDVLACVKDSVDPAEAVGCIWILKPASYANRGFGIKVVRGLQAALDVAQRLNSAGSQRSDCTEGSSSSSCLPPGADPFNMTKRATDIAKNNGWICQEYMCNPLLVSGRKFDIRCFVLLTNSTKEGFKAFWFRDGYIRTSCKKYSLSKLSDRETHLTNDAVQKHSKSYGKFESGNKLTYAEWQDSINKDYPDTPGDIVERQILPQIKEMAKVAVLAALDKGLAKTKINRSFELLGYDFMIDADFRPVLIEINTNPCLEFACPLLESLIGSLIDNVWKVAVDGFFKPPIGPGRTKNTEEAIQAIESEPALFELIYDSTTS